MPVPLTPEETAEIERMQRQINLIQARAARRNDAVETLRGMPNRTVLRFDVYFRSRESYVYAAVRAASKWFITSATTTPHPSSFKSPMDSAELVAWVVSHGCHWIEVMGDAQPVRLAPVADEDTPAG